MAILDFRIDRKADFAVSTQIETYLRAKILNRELAPGERLPTTMEIVNRIGVSAHTVREAMANLAKEGLLRITPGRGTFVARQIKDDPEMTSAMAHPRKISNIGVFSAILSTAQGPKLEHPETVEGIYGECKTIGARAHLVSPFIDLLSEKEVLNEAQRGNYDGIIWLYPDSTCKETISRLSEQGIPFVLTSHDHFEVDFTRVEIDEARVTYRIFQELAGAGCERIYMFSGDEAGSHTYNPLKIIQHYFKNALLAFQRDKNAYLEVMKQPKDGEEFLKWLKDAPLDKVKTGLIIPNGPPYQEILSEKVNELAEIIADTELVVLTPENESSKLQPLVEKRDFWVAILPFRSVGRFAVQKLMAVFEGRLENTTTMISCKFGKAPEMNL